MDSSPAVASNLVGRSKVVSPASNVPHPIRNRVACRKPVHLPCLGGSTAGSCKSNITSRLGKCSARGQWPPARLRFETTTPRSVSSSGSVCSSPFHMGGFSGPPAPVGLPSRFPHADVSPYSGRISCLPLHEVIRVIQRMLCGVIPEVAGPHLNPGAHDIQYLDHTFQISHRRFHYASYVYCIKLFDLFMAPTLLHK